MKNVYTNNGNFIITDSLLEAIKGNNPELLLEKQNDSRKSNREERKYDAELAKQRRERRAKKQLDDEELMSKKSSIEDLGEVDSQISIYLGQLEKSQQNLMNIGQSNYDDSYKLSSDTLKEMEDFINTYKNSNNENIKQQISKFEDEYNTYKENEKEIKDSAENKDTDFNKVNNQSNDNGKMYNGSEANKKDIEGYMNLETPDDFITFKPLLNEIRISESMARGIVNRAEDVMEEVMGVWGRTDYTKKSEFSYLKDVNNMNKTDIEMQINDLTNKLSSATISPSQKKSINDNLFYLKQYYKKRYGETNYLKGNEESPNLFNQGGNNTQDPYQYNLGLDNKIQTTSTNAQKYGKNPALLALGGFQIKPYFTNSSNMSSKGYALKYFLEFMNNAGYINKDKDKDNKSYISEMINVYKNTYKNINKQLKSLQNNSSVDDTVKANQKFIKMVDNFLANTVYSVSINNNQKFENAVNAVRIDPNLNGKYKVTTLSTQQQFNVKERIIGFINKSTGIPTAILIFRPLFARGQEIFKPLEKAISGRVTEG